MHHPRLSFSYSTCLRVWMVWYNVRCTCTATNSHFEFRTGVVMRKKREENCVNLWTVEPFLCGALYLLACTEDGRMMMLTMASYHFYSFLKWASVWRRRRRRQRHLVYLSLGKHFYHHLLCAQVNMVYANGLVFSACSKCVMTMFNVCFGNIITTAWIYVLTTCTLCVQKTF